MAATSCIFADLKVDKNLLHAKFESYKLSLEAIPRLAANVNSGVRCCDASDTQWSYQHVRLYSEQNHLYADPFDLKRDVVYTLANDGTVYHATLKERRIAMNPVYVVRFPPDFNIRTDRYNFTLNFASANWAFLSDGCGKLITVRTGDRSSAEEWKAVAVIENALPDGQPFVILQSIQRSESTLEVLLQRITEEKSSNEVAMATDSNNGTTLGDSSFGILLYWLTFDTAVGQITRTRILKSSGIVNYAALSCDYDGLCIATSKPVTFVSDSLVPVKPKIDEHLHANGEPSVVKRYTWGQTGDEACAVFTVPEGLKKEEVEFELSSGGSHIRLKLKCVEKPLLAGELFDAVQADESTWTLSDNRIEITLIKRSESDHIGLWPELVKGDKTGEYCPDPDTRYEINERLDALTAAVETVPAKDQPNPQGLEECDAITNETEELVWIDGSEHEPKFEADIGGHQWMFSVPLDGSTPPAFCLRHDVDGLLWQVASNPTLVPSKSCFTHVATFDALGYVQAAKERRKFTSCSPNWSYAVIVECNKHAFVYWQAVPVESELRHRSSGQRIADVSKQQLISLETDDEFLGAVASNSVLFLLTTNELIACLLKQ